MTANVSARAPRATSGSLQHIPIPLFAMVMGITGLGLAWRKGHEVLGVTLTVSDAICALGALAFLAVAVLYGAKMARHPAAVRAEFDHPVRGAFFPTFSVSLLLLAIAADHHLPAAAEGLWIVGTTLHLLFTLRVLRRWIVHPHSLDHVNPAWFIPVVGNVVVPLLGVRLGYVELSWFFLSIGLVFWLVLLTVVFYRMVFHDDLPPKLMPTLFILIAPPAVGFLAYVGLQGGTLDAFARILAHMALFTALVVFSLLPALRKVPFAVSWWAYTFPLDALAIALLQYGALAQSPMMVTLGAVALGTATLVVAVVLVRTVRGVVSGTLFVPE